MRGISKLLNYYKTDKPDKALGQKTMDNNIFSQSQTTKNWKTSDKPVFQIQQHLATLFDVGADGVTPDEVVFAHEV